MRWNRRWISGDRFARDYAADILSFADEVAQAVTRFHPARHCPIVRDLNTHAVAWAAVLVAFESACFREQDREVLMELMLGELRPRWDLSELACSAAILEQSAIYFARRNGSSRMATADELVSSYLRYLGVPEPIDATALARHLRANFTYRILRDIYLLSAASRLRSAVVSLMERQRAVRVAEIDNRGLSVWGERERDDSLAKTRGGASNL